MTFDEHDIFETRTPPSGGLTRLRSRIDRLERRRAWITPALAAATAIMIAGIILLSTRPPAPSVLGQQTHAAIVSEHPGFVARGIVPTNDAPVQAIGETTLLPHPSGNPKVLVYYVSGSQTVRLQK